MRKLPPPLRIFQCRADGIDVFLAGPVIGKVHDEPGVTAVVVVAPPEQGGALIQPGALQRAEIFRQPINLLIDIGLAQMPDTAGFEWMLNARVRHKEVGARFHTYAGELCQRMTQANHLSRAAKTPLNEGVAKGQEIKCKLLDRGSGQ